MKKLLIKIGLLVIESIIVTSVKAVTLNDFHYNSEKGCFEIRSAEDMVNLSLYINGGKKQGKFMVVVPELDFENVAFTPIGSKDYFFSGCFYGQGVVIKNLNLNFEEQKNIGLFGYVNDGQINDVILDASCNIHGYENVGGIVGTLVNVGGVSSATISGCVNNGSVTSSHGCVGGIVGCNSGGVIIGCINGGNVSSPGFRVGGILGYDNSKNYAIASVVGCINKGPVKGDDGCVGGIIGENEGSVIDDCKNEGDVSGTGWVGGIAGINRPSYHAIIKNCIVISCTISSSASFVGAIVGKFKYEDAAGQSKLSENYYDEGVNLFFGEELITGERGVGSRYDIGMTYKPYNIYSMTNDYVVEGEDLIFYNGATTKDFGGIATLNKDKILEEFSYNKDGYYEIKSAKDIQALANIVNAGDRCYGRVFKIVVEEIDFSDIEIAPIANKKAFWGTLDGNNAVIKNLSIVENSNDSIAFFGENRGTLKNIVLDSTCLIKGHSYVAGIVGSNYGIVSNCSNHSQIEGRSDIGGIASYNQGIVKNCRNDGFIKGDFYSGGIVGSNSGAVCFCSNTGNVGYYNIRERHYRVGGIAGCNYSIINCCFVSRSSVIGSYYTGAIVGENKSGLADNYYFPNVIVMDSGYSGSVPRGVGSGMWELPIDLNTTTYSGKELYNCTVLKFLGDANGDKYVNVADVVEIVNAIDGKPSDNLDVKAADVNFDGNIDVFDVNQLVRIIMSE